jgi:hypothetical protein
MYGCQLQRQQWPIYRGNLGQGYITYPLTPEDVRKIIKEELDRKKD